MKEGFSSYVAKSNLNTTLFTVGTPIHSIRDHISRCTDPATNPVDSNWVPNTQQISRRHNASLMEYSLEQSLFELAFEWPNETFEVIWMFNDFHPLVRHNDSMIESSLERNTSFRTGFRVTEWNGSIPEDGLTRLKWFEC